MSIFLTALLKHLFKIEVTLKKVYYKQYVQLFILCDLDL